MLAALLSATCPHAEMACANPVSGYNHTGRQQPGDHGAAEPSEETY